MERYFATTEDCQAGMGATLENPPPLEIRAPVAGEHTTSVPPPAQGVTPVGFFLHTEDLGEARGRPSTS